MESFPRVLHTALKYCTTIILVGDLLVCKFEEFAN